MGSKSLRCHPKAIPALPSLCESLDDYSASVRVEVQTRTLYTKQIVLHCQDAANDTALRAPTDG
jgi:hypothetical protein